MIQTILLDFIKAFSSIKLDTEVSLLGPVKKAVHNTILDYYNQCAYETETYKTPDTIVQHICEVAAQILLNPSGYYAIDGNVPLPIEHDPEKKYKTLFNFRASWLRAAGLCLDSNKAEVMQILPYLLYCYTLNSSRNKIDCFDPHIDYTTGDNSLFSEYFLNNPHRNAKSLRNYFFYQDDPIHFDIRELPPFGIKYDKAHDGEKISSELNAILKATETGIPPEKMEPLSSIHTQRLSLSQLDLESDETLGYLYKQPLKKNAQLTVLKKQMEHQVRFYELCRRFLAFVYACAEHQEACKYPINLSLSFALFCKTITIVNEAEKGMKRKSKSLFGPFYRDDIMADKHRPQLVALSTWTDIQHFSESTLISRIKLIPLSDTDYLLKRCNVYSLAYASKRDLWALYQPHTLIPLLI